MFTGIIEELGKVKDLKRRGDVSRLTVLAKDITRNVDTGDSIAVNGACLTLVEFTKDELTFEVMNETLSKTTIGTLRRNDSVNLEPSLKLGDKLSGHILSGHIDTVGKVKKIVKSSKTCQIEISFPVQLRKYIAPKGSIALDGVSLSVGEVGRDWFSVYLIPHTLKLTRFNSLKSRNPVNIEVDLIARYVQGMISHKEGITDDFLKRKGFA